MRRGSAIWQFFWAIGMALGAFSESPYLFAVAALFYAEEGARFVAAEHAKAVQR